MKIEARTMEAEEIIIEVKKDCTLALTAIFNKWRENRYILYVDNDWYNNIYVTVIPDSKDSVIKWLEQFGVIKSVEKILACVIDKDSIVIDKNSIDYDFIKYDKFVITVEQKKQTVRSGNSAKEK